MIDPAMGWIEISHIDTKRADTISNVCEQAWLTPCILYKRKFDTSNLKLVKLKKENNAGHLRSKKVPIFTASIGVEGLFHVISKYEKAAMRLGFTIGDHWTYFEDVLDSTAADKWENLNSTIVPQTRTQVCFDEAIQEFVGFYSKHPEPRDVQICPLIC